MVQPEIERTSAVTTFLKFVHLAAIALWSGGLIALPFLFWQRRALEAGLDLDRLHRVTGLSMSSWLRLPHLSLSAAERR